MMRIGHTRVVVPRCDVLVRRTVLSDVHPTGADVVVIPTVVAVPQTWPRARYTRSAKSSS